MPFVDSNLGQIHYSLEGPSDKPFLVLSNSLGTDFTMWDPQMPAFTKSLRILRYDTRGHGKSAVTPGPYSIEQLAKDGLTLADALKLDRFHLCSSAPEQTHPVQHRRENWHCRDVECPH
jgi:3-oxoadipate enol-lactonase